MFAFCFFLVLLSFLAGRFLDPIWRAKQLRKITKKNYIVVAMVSKDQRTIKEKVINAEKDIIEMDGKFWVINQNTIYRKERTLSKHKTNLSKSDVVWEEEVPVVFLSEDTLRPLVFHKDEHSVKPSEVAAVLKSWIANQKAKDIMSQKQQLLFTVIILVVLAAVAYLSWQNWDALQNLKNHLSSLQETATKTIVEQPKG
jgi:lipopolysaccharide export LptBFGC system permease protein LptF